MKYFLKVMTYTLIIVVTIITSIFTDTVKAETPNNNSEVFESTMLVEPPLLLSHTNITEIENDPTATVVYDYNELKSTLETDNGISTIYLGNDITITATITIHINKSDVEINGYIPESGQAENYTLGQASAAQVYFNGTNRNSLTYQNMKFNNSNYYGTVYSDSSNFTATFRNVEYVGPQILYFLGSNVLIQMIDSTFSMQVNGGISIQEYIEVGLNTTMTLEGNVLFEYIDSPPANDSFEDLATFIVLDNSYVEINSGGAAGLGYPMLRAETIEVGVNSTLKIHDENHTFTNYILRASDAQSMKLHLKENSTFDITHSGSLSIETIFRTNDFRMDNDSSLILNAPNITYYTWAPIMLNRNSSDKFIFDNPKLVYLNTGIQSRMFTSYLTTPSTLPLTLPGNAFNLSANTNQVPDFIWNNSDNSTFNVNLEIPSLSNPTFSSSSNYTGIAGTPELNATNYSFPKQVFAFGKMSLAIDPVCAQGSQISGTTEPNSNVKANYTGTDDTPYTVDTTSDSSGKFVATISTQPKLNTNMEIIASNNYLSTRQSVEVVEQVGDLNLTSIPNLLAFNEISIPSTVTRVGLQNPNWTISVDDTRCNLTTWDLRVAATPFSATVNSNTVILPASLIYIDPSDNETIISSSPTKVVTQTGTNGTTNILGSDGNEIVLQIGQGPEPIYANTTYTSTVTWTLVDAP